MPPSEVILGEGAITVHEAMRIWADTERRAEYQTGLLDVAPEVDAALARIESRTTEPNPLRWGARLFRGRDDA